MQAIIHLPLQSAPLVQRAAAAISAGMLLFGPIAAVVAPQRPQLPALPSPWRAVPGSQIVTPVQRFVAYTRDRGLEVHLHSAIGLEPAATHALFAVITLSGNRVEVYADPAGRRFEARWGSGEAFHRLAAGPTGLADFMELLFSLDWW